MPTAGNDGKGRKGTTSRLPKAQREHIIIEIATRLFTSRGYADTTLELIAEASKMSPGVLRKSFAAKSTLFTAILETWQGWIVQPATELAVDQPAPDLLAILNGFADRFLRTSRQEASLFRLLTHALFAPSEPEEQEAALVCLHHAVAPLVWLLQAGQQAGIFRRVPDTRIAAQDCFRFLLGSALLPVTSGEKADELPVPVLDTFLHGILKMDV